MLFLPPLYLGLLLRLRRRRVAACNVGPARPLRVCSAINETLGAATEGEWIRVAPYGDFPITVQVDGAPRRLVQKMDREAADLMVAAFNSLLTTAGTLGRGLPIFEGHVDSPEWLARHPSARKAAVGRLKKLEARDDGLWALPAFNSIGEPLVRGEAPAYVAQSPHWDLDLIGERATARAARPALLRSIALTNTPNIPGNVLGLNEDDEPSPEPTTTMHPLVLELLALFGQTLTADAAPAAQESALKAAIAKAKEGQGETSKLKLLDDKAALAEGKAVAAANEAATLKASLAAERAARSGVVVDLAVKAGRIPQAKRGEWVSALNEATDFAAKAGELDKLVSAINTTSAVSNLSARREESAKQTAGISAINEAVDSHMKTHGITNRDLAWNAVKAAKPELFK